MANLKSLKLVVSFRVKLLLAMMMVVAGVTGATLYVTQERVQATYQRLFLERFQTQIKFFSTRQFGRLRVYRDRTRELAASTLMIVALREATDDQKLDALYRSTLADLFDTSGGPAGSSADLAESGRSPTAARPATTLPPLEGMFFRFLDAKGRVIPTTDPRAGMIGEARRRRMELQLVIVGRTLERIESQTVGYLAPENQSGRAELVEVIVTPVMDPANRRLLGAMVFGLPLSDLEERDLNDLTQIKSGIWLERKLYTRTIPPTLRGDIAARMEEEVVPSDRPESQFAIEGKNEPYWVFCRALNPRSAFPTAYQVCLYSLAGAEQEKQDLRWRIAGFALLGVLGALALSFLLSHGLTVPIWELVAGTNEIRSGNLTVKVQEHSQDELGHLARSFNEMTEGLAMKEKYRDVLNKVSDKAVAQELMQGGVNLGGEEREVSVLFCDIRGFTGLTQNMAPPEIIQLLNEHMTALTRVVDEHHGVVDKFVGDLIMAVFGAPKAYGNDAESAVRCALRMIQERARLNLTSKHQIQVGIGIATGRVIAGCMGSADRLNYTVLGRHVNLGSRLCGQAGPMDVVIDANTRQKLGDLLSVVPTDPLQLKGFDESVQAFRLIEVRPRTSGVAEKVGDGQA